ncbi:hypothetical protein Ahy_B08g093757 [Arachis hypogaea]|uniref:SWIM-type domain-containing protein n=1 Tax=Arachis hypogaea TaxID=3818 RepID=A0A444Y6W5_ARAHY|nr:hypothetical protein Ahy_B08g093757 [Arachis hypogaea]
MQAKGTSQTATTLGIATAPSRRTPSTFYSAAAAQNSWRFRVHPAEPRNTPHGPSSIGRNTGENLGSKRRGLRIQPQLPAEESRNGGYQEKGGEGWPLSKTKSFSGGGGGLGFFADIKGHFNVQVYIRTIWVYFREVWPLCVVDDQFIPKVGMTFNTLEDATKFYKDYAKAAGFSTRVVLHHSHPCYPTQAEMLKQHREQSMSVRRTIENNEEAGIKPSKTYQSFVAAAGGHRELNFIEKDVRNYITREVRNVSEQEDAKEFGKYLLRMKEKNQNFFFELELEDDQSIKLAFWADARSKTAFEYFRDVISFDTTYNTNKYNLVCGSFVGVNHHSQSILLGCALMKNEDVESFKWLFQCWLRCMGANAPKGILTDQCASMKRAIEAYLYEDRLIWVPIYLDHHFWAGMRSTQRSESMHSFFNKFITRNSSLIQFVKQCDNCLGSREQREREFDAADFHTVIPYATKSSIKAQFNMCYSVYEVGEQVFSSIFNKFVVTYDLEAAQVKCQCLLFESRGILCRHALSVLSFERIKSSHDEPLLEPKSKRFDELVFRSQNICEFATESKELTAILHRAYDNVMVEMEELKAKRKGICSLSHEDANLESVNELQSPPHVRTRGRPKNRLGSKLDKQITNVSKKKKTKALSEIKVMFFKYVVTEFNFLVNSFANM